MRLDLQKLPKAKGHHSRVQPKHIKSTKREERRKDNKVAKEIMQIETIDKSNNQTSDMLSVDEKLLAKEERKKLTRESLLYKKNNTAISGRNGPRAITK